MLRAKPCEQGSVRNFRSLLSVSSYFVFAVFKMCAIDIS